MELNVKLKFETKLDKAEAQKLIVDALALLGKKKIYVTKIKMDNENELEKCLVLVKPSYSRNTILCKEVKKELEALGLKIIYEGYKKFNRTNGKCHYIDKAQTDYYDELVDYITSDVVYGFIVEGMDAITKARTKVKELRISLKDKYSLKTDVMRNILHCTSKVIINNQNFDINSKREIDNFLSASDGLI